MAQTGEANVHSSLAPDGSVRLLKTFHVAKLVNDWMFGFGIDVSDELKGVEEICLYRCDISHLDFFMPYSAVGSDRLYQALQRFDWYHMVDKWEFRQAIRDLTNCRRILEVGCGPGHFIESALKKLTGSVVKGIDLNESVVALAAQNGLPVECIDLDQVVAKGETYDAVCSFQVLEHTHRPREFIEAMVKVLVPNGTLIISVPNRDSFTRYEYNLLDIPPHHMTRWNVTTFKYLEKLFPIRLLRVRYEPLAQYHIRDYVMAYTHYWRTRSRLARSVLSARVLQRLATWLEKTGFYHFLRGHTLYVVFEKL